MDEVERGRSEDALTDPAGRGDARGEAREEALRYPAAVLALVVGLEGGRVREVARALSIHVHADEAREQVAMRVASHVARTGGISRLLGLLETPELRRTCGDVLGLPAHGDRVELVSRLERWLSLFVEEGAEPVAPADLIAGRWRVGALREVIGVGALHEVVDTRLRGRPPAVALVAHLPSDVGLEREVEVGLRLTHPGIVRVLDHGIDREGRDVAIVDDPGAPLLRWLEGGTASVDQARRMVLALAAALDHAHASGVSHGAVDASCVWVDREERVRLSGFGRTDAPTCDQRGLARLFVTLVTGSVDGDLDDLDAAIAAPLRRALSGAAPFGTCLDLALALLGVPCG